MDKEIAELSSLCTGCAYRTVYLALRDLGVHWFGGLRCSTEREPFFDVAQDLSLPDLIYQARESYRNGLTSVAIVISDRTLLRSDLTALGMRESIPLTIIALDNGTSGACQQQTRTGLWETMREAGFQIVSAVNTWSLLGTKRGIAEAVHSSRLAIVVARGDCQVRLQADGIRFDRPFRIDRNRCYNCHLCLALGCPCLNMDSTDCPTIREEECVGCGCCAQVCPIGAILPVS